MNIIKANIENLTSLWQTVSAPFQGNSYDASFNSSIIEYSQWPNKLWFNEDFKAKHVDSAIKKMGAVDAKWSIPYWDIYGTKFFILLEEKGFDLKFEQIGMSLKLKDKFNTSGSLKLEKVKTERDAGLWSDLFASSFGYLIHPTLLISTPAMTSCYIAYHGHVPVGTGMLHTTGVVTGIHSVGIVPAHRRKGFADEIMKQLINKASARGSEYATLQASNMGKALYLKLGFEAEFAIKNYVLK